MEGEGDIVILPCNHAYLLDSIDDNASAVICSVCNTRYAEPGSEGSLPDLDLQEVWDEDVNVVLFIADI